MSGETLTIVLPPEAAGGAAGQGPGRQRASADRRRQAVPRPHPRPDGCDERGDDWNGDRRVTNPSAKAKAGDTYLIAVPPPEAAEPEAQAIPLTVLYEDASPDRHRQGARHGGAPGARHAGRHAGERPPAPLRRSLSGVGGVARPGIVHRLDKDTSGVMVAAKTDAAHQGLSKLFAAHDIERTYIALVRGAPEPSHDTVTTQIGRARFDRQRMAVLKAGGREAITHYKVQAVWGERTSKGDRALAARVSCTLETGRTHQIRVHMAHKGAPVLGDPLYGSSPPVAKVKAAIEEAGLQRQALHAAILGFIHPITGEAMRFETAPAADMTPP